MNWSRSVVICAGIAVVAMAAVKAAEPLIPMDKPYYTKCNIWFDKKDRIPSTNYHTGLILPVGTKVKITACSAKCNSMGATGVQLSKEPFGWILAK